MCRTIGNVQKIRKIQKFRKTSDQEREIWNHEEMAAFQMGFKKEGTREKMGEKGNVSKN